MRALTTVAVLASLALPAAVPAGEKSYRPQPEDLRQPVLWGAECLLADGSGLAFGGCEQAAEDGRQHTKIKEGGAWKPIIDELRAKNPLQKHSTRAWDLRTRTKNAAARARFVWFKGLEPAEEQKRLKAEVVPAVESIAKDLEALVAELGGLKLEDYEAGQAKFALALVQSAAGKIKPLAAALANGVTAEQIKALSAAQVELERVFEALDCEPTARAYSPIAHDEKSKLFILFGGDHLDYLTNDTWVFDPAKRKWMQRHPASAPSPRAQHGLQAAGDGKVTLSGGYNYTSNTDYCGAQYATIVETNWTYDVSANAWSGPDARQPGSSRTYRSGPFHPDFYMAGARPDAEKFQAQLAGLPVNTWVKLDVLRRPRLDRIWGTAIIAPDRDLILVWGGGHSSHGGSDVLHYHLSSGRWELPYPVEFPLGQLYSNTSYPDSFNLNRRPWVTGHTYRNYGYDPASGKMYFLGHTTNGYIYDPVLADWIGRFVKPGHLLYYPCFYDLTCCSTPKGLTVWGGNNNRPAFSKISRLDAGTNQWNALPLTGDALPGSMCDEGSMVYDAKRDRLLCFRRDGAWREKDKGCLTVEVDLKTMKVLRLTPTGQEATKAIGFLREFCYDIEHDLVVGTTVLPAQADGLFRVPVYECAANRWASLKIAGPNPSGKSADVVVSLGLVYDAKRKLIWCMDNYNLQPYVLRLDPAAADLQPLTTPAGKEAGGK